MARWLFCGISIIACVAASAANAQAKPQAGSTRKTRGTLPAQAAPISDEGLADIIVTATKVETTLQKTPQAIQTIGGDVLARQGISDAQQLNKLVGGLQVESNGPNSSIYIRGVGSRVLSSTSDPAVAFSVDGVYYARPAGIGTTFFDVSRLEVVKGPQGTLYGRNATGGAVNLVSNQPKLGMRSLDGEIEVGNYQSVRAMAAVNLPLGDKAALRLAGQTVYHKGYLSDGYDDANTKSFRASLFVEPSDRFSLYLSGDYAHQGGQGPGAIPVGPGSNNNALTTRFVVPGSPWTGPSDPRVNAFLHAAAPAQALPLPLPGTYCVGIPFLAPTAPDPTGQPAVLACNTPIGVNSIQPDGFDDNSFYGVNITANYDAGFAKLTAIGGYRGSKIRTRFAVDPNFQNARTDTDQYSGELRLASAPGDGPVEWLVGAFYLRENQNVYQISAIGNTAVPNPFPTPGSPLPGTQCISPLDPDGPGPAPAVPGLCVANTLVQSYFQLTEPNLVSETYAAFGQSTVSLASWIRLTGGIRYTHELKSAANGLVTSIYAVPAGVTTAYPSLGSVKYQDVSYRGGLELDLARRSMLYATFSSAFHAGGFQFGVQQGPNKYEYLPEKVRSYVVGIKNRFLDNRLQVNVEAFWLDYDNYQQNSVGRVNDGSVACTQLGIIDACPLTLRTDNAATARVRGVEGDVVFAPARNTTLNVNVLYNDAKFTRFVLPNPFGGPASVYDGARIPGSVPWTVTGGINQAFDLPKGGRLIADARSQFKSSAYLWFTNLPAVYQKGYTRTDLSLTYEPAAARFSVTGFVRNVEGKATLLQGGPVDNTTGAMWTNLNPPRTYGVMVGFHF